MNRYYETISENEEEKNGLEDWIGSKEGQESVDSAWLILCIC